MHGAAWPGPCELLALALRNALPSAVEDEIGEFLGFVGAVCPNFEPGSS
jgi:hypothetical protein